MYCKKAARIIARLIFSVSAVAAAKDHDGDENDPDAVVIFKKIAKTVIHNESSL